MLQIWFGVSLGIKVISIELFHPFQHGFVFLVFKVLISAMTMPRIEGVEAQHVKRLIRKIGFHDLRNVTIVAESHVDVLQATMRFVDPILCLVLGNLCVRIPSKIFRKDYLIGPSTSNRKCIAYHTPLRLTV